MANSNIHIYRKDTNTEVVGSMAPVPLRKDQSESKIIPMCVKTDAGYKILSTTVEGGVGCIIQLQHNFGSGGDSNGGKLHWFISSDNSTWSSASPATITLSGGADSTGSDFWLKCDCEPLETVGLHDYATLSAYGVVEATS